MFAVKPLLLGLTLGMLLGLWFGVNIGKDNPLLANPFAERSVQKKMRHAGGELLKQGGMTLRKQLER